ncbi:DUF6350 family protein [Nocardioides sp. R-C-SC26]|uniref:cell division protein PerM n=1 Tax=Nocardioides sp. R-C-SC26 TaxID=2870414 RepID=UPI001E409369|nr:DUF6350 family protein [Nocardioides sp. R-C-SC26]
MATRTSTRIGATSGSAARTKDRSTGRTAAQVRAELATRRPVAVVATLAGVTAAVAPLLVLLACGVMGWFATDGGAHGAPRDGLRVGALLWLMGHGSGVQLDGVAITAMPWGVTLVAAWAIWRSGVRAGESVSGHGPDADGVADGQRDLVVPVTAGVFAAGYVVTAVLVATLAATPSTAPDTGHVMAWSVLLCLAVAVPAIAVGSGRAAVWTAPLPAQVADTLDLLRRLLVAWVLLCLVVLAVSFAVDLSTAANVLSLIGAEGPESLIVVALTLLIVPNAVAFTGSYLLGPGFAVGAGTVVSPTTVVLGPLPMVPLLAALPDNGPTPGWTPWLMVLPALVAAYAGGRSLWRRPTVRYDEAIVRAVIAGAGAAVLVAIAAAVAGGAVGPGRMAEVGPFAMETLLRALPAFVLGAVAGACAVTWWNGRLLAGTSEPVDRDDDAEGLTEDVTDVEQR